MATIRTDKKCVKCNSSSFSKNGSKNGIQQWHCKPCHSDRQKRHSDSGKKRLRDVERMYGIERQEYVEMYNKQDGKCAICRDNESMKDYRTGNSRNLAVDHSHISGNVRGLLCQKCNQGLGYFKDNKDSLLSAVKYLENHSG